MTPRDREIVRWIGRHQFVTAAQVAERFGLGRSQCYARLTGLVRLGLLRHERLLHGQPGIYLGTRSGLDLAGVALPAATVDLRTYMHDLGVVSLVGKLEAAAGGDHVITEREIRAIDTPVGVPRHEYKARYAVQLPESAQLKLTSSSTARVHFPDAVLCPEDGPPTAIELERSLKGRACLRRILRAYVAARHLAGVRYFVADACVARVVEAEARDLRAGGVIVVEQIA